MRACVRACKHERAVPAVDPSLFCGNERFPLSLSSLPFALDDVMMTTRVRAALTEETILFEAGPEIL